jgi:hypothetical protein
MNLQTRVRGSNEIVHIHGFSCTIIHIVRIYIVRILLHVELTSLVLFLDRQEPAAISSNVMYM